MRYGDKFRRIIRASHHHLIQNRVISDPICRRTCDIHIADQNGSCGIIHIYHLKLACGKRCGRKDERQTAPIKGNVIDDTSKPGRTAPYGRQGRGG